MTIDDQNAEPLLHAGQTRKRRILRVLAVIIGVLAAVDLIITVIPQPPPRQTRISPLGGIVSSTSYSSTEDSIVEAKNWVEVYLNPVGWVALFNGYGSDRLYILKRNKNWQGALEAGQMFTLVALLVLPLIFWTFSLGTGATKSAKT